MKIDFLSGISNVYGSPIMALAGAPLTTFSALTNGAIHFPSELSHLGTNQTWNYPSFSLHLASTATVLNPSQLAQQYATALACPITTPSNPGTTLLTTTSSPLSLSTLQAHPHATTSSTSPYILLSTSTSASSDEVCANAGTADLTSSLLTGKTASLSSPSTVYFYNHNSTPTMYPADFLHLW